MNSAAKVNADVEAWKKEGISKAELITRAAEDMIGWPYAWGSTGQRCTVPNRQQRIANPKISAGDIALIKKHCQQLNGSGKSVCAGCIYYPCYECTLMHDCIGFVNRLLDIAGVDHYGAGCTTMWNHAANWEQKGPISEMPDTVCCVFRQNGNKMEHIGMHIGGGWVIHCSVEVKKQNNYKWTHYGIPKGMGGVIPPAPVPPEPPTPIGYAVVTGKKVALRKDPSLQAVVITRVDTGEMVKLENPPLREWDYVSYNRNTGWMMREFLREEGNNAIVTGKKVALRKDPSLRAAIITRINTGETVHLEPDPESKWAYVSYKNNVGYMMKEFLKEG